MPEPSFLLLGAIVLAAFSVEATAGFGSMVIALTFGSHLYSIAELLPVLVPLNLLITLYMVTRHRGHVAGKLIAYRILPVMGAGVAIGLVLFTLLESAVLKRCFGAMIVVLSILELWKLWRSVDMPARPWTFLNTIYVHVAGIIHGIYATGGPLLVYSLGRTRLPKSSLRSTLAMIWVVFDVVLAVTFLIAGRLDATAAERMAMLSPLVIIAIAIGEWSHGRIPERPFRILVFTLLLGAGISIVV